ncbi:MAG: nucleoside-diphosphate kinase [Anaerolineae bacterium]
MERTLVLIKPYGVQRGLIGKVIDRFERQGMRIVGLKLMRMDEALGRKHYAAHVSKGFFPGLLEYMTSGPIAAMVVEGENAIERARAVMGATDPVKAAPGTIRAEWAMDVQRNLVHGSDSPESARTEISLFFSDSELFSYDKVVDERVGS